MGIFRNCRIALELSTSLPWKQKQEIKKIVASNGGVVSYIVTRQVWTATDIAERFLVVSMPGTP